jgi:hypothetical protein
VNEEKFAEHLNAQAARLAAEDSRLLSLPQTPEAYKTELPADFKAPEGVTFQFNENDPLLAQAKAVAHELKIPQEGFNKLLGLYAGAQVATEAQVQAARSQEIAKLGPAGPARVTAVQTFLKSTIGDEAGNQIVARLFTASDVQAMEKLVARFASQGSAGFSQQHRDVSVGRVDQAAYEKMSYTERKAYAAQFPQSNGDAR